MRKITVAVVLSSAAAALLVGCSGVESASTGEGSKPAASKSDVAAAGSTVRDGKFEFTVKGIDRAKTVGDPDNEFMTVDAQGEFIVVTLGVTNIGNEAQSFFSDNQKLMDDQGRTFKANTEADIWLNQGTHEINPGNAVEVKLALDVPPGTVPASLQLHDSMFSGGVKVGV